MASVSAQCFSCKCVREINNAETLLTTNNRHRLSGECASCGKKVSKFICDPNKPASAASTTPDNSPSLQAEKKIKKKTRKQSLKRCANCLCKTHEQIIEAQPKKQRRVGTPKPSKKVEAAVAEAQQQQEEEEQRPSLQEVTAMIEEELENIPDSQ